MSAHHRSAALVGALSLLMAGCAAIPPQSQSSQQQAQESQATQDPMEFGSYGVEPIKLDTKAPCELLAPEYITEFDLVDRMDRLDGNGNCRWHIGDHAYKSVMLRVNESGGVAVSVVRHDESSLEEQSPESQSKNLEVEGYPAGQTLSGPTFCILNLATSANHSVAIRVNEDNPCGLAAEIGAAIIDSA